jgi:hypothetical protein
MVEQLRHPHVAVEPVELFVERQPQAEAQSLVEPSPHGEAGGPDGGEAPDGHPVDLELAGGILVGPGVVVPHAGRDDVDLVPPGGQAVRRLPHHRLRAADHVGAVAGGDEGDPLRVSHGPG